jgi:hypothetical protein
MRPMTRAVAATGVAGLCAGVLLLGSAARAQNDAAAVVDRAIAYAGGAALLAKNRALEWDGAATIHIPGRTIEIAGTWRVQPPDRAVVSTYEVAKGPSTARTLILSGSRGWLQQAAVTPMPPDVYAEERHQFYLYALLRALPLRGAELTVEALPSTALGSVLRVRAPTRPDVTLTVNAEGQIVHMRTVFATVGGREQAAQELTLSGQLESGGLRWFRQMTITRDGAPYYEMRLDRVRFLPELPDPTPAGRR